MDLTHLSVSGNSGFRYSGAWRSIFGRVMFFTHTIARVYLFECVCALVCVRIHATLLTL
jgi:hypothetical protein